MQGEMKEQDELTVLVGAIRAALRGQG